MKTPLCIALVLVSFQTLAKDTYIYKVHPGGTRTKEYIYKEPAYQSPFPHSDSPSAPKDTYIYKIHPSGTHTREFVYQDNNDQNPFPEPDASEMDTLFMDDDSFFME